MCCLLAAVLVVSHHLDGSGSTSVRGILHPSRTGFASFRVRVLTLRPSARLYPPKHPSPNTPNSRTIAEPLGSPNSHWAALDLCPSERNPERTRPHWTDGRCITTRTRRTRPRFGTCCRFPRCACTLRRTSLTNSRQTLLFPLAPPPFLRPRGFTPFVRPESDSALLRSSELFSFHGLLFPLQGASAPPLSNLDPRR